jgi:hypothetical protein
LDRREALLDAREAALDERMVSGRAILEAADQRDAAADDRDEAAQDRSNDLDRTEFAAEGDSYGERWPERRDAALGREHAKDDRTASHGDRIALTEPDPDS